MLKQHSCWQLATNAQTHYGLGHRKEGGGGLASRDDSEDKSEGEVLEVVYVRALALAPSVGASGPRMTFLAFSCL